MSKATKDGLLANKQSVKEGLVMKKTVKGGKDKGWKQRYLVLTLDSLEYYDKKKKSKRAIAACPRTRTLP
eukprot:COSAG02_NODE_2211_length_9495_cov_3.415842_1_plen_70_part_00